MDKLTWYEDKNVDFNKLSNYEFMSRQKVLYFAYTNELTKLYRLAQVDLFYNLISNLKEGRDITVSNLTKLLKESNETYDDIIALIDEALSMN